MEDKPLITDPYYVQGQIYGLSALIYALADQIDPYEFRTHALAAIERARTAILPSAMHDATLLGLDSIEASVDHLTRDFRDPG